MDNGCHGLRASKQLPASSCLHYLREL